MIADVTRGLSEWWAPVLAFVAGVVSFASPCVLPLVPGYLAFVSGTDEIERHPEGGPPPEAPAGDGTAVAGGGRARAPGGPRGGGRPPLAVVGGGGGVGFAACGV